MKQCPECSRYARDFSTVCKCGYAYPYNGEGPEPRDDASAHEGSRLMTFCSVMSVLAILTSIVSGFLLAGKGHLVAGVVTAVLGSLYHAGMLVVFLEVGQIIGERKANQARTGE